MQRSRSTGTLSGMNTRLLAAPPALKGVTVGLQPDALRVSLGGAGGTNWSAASKNVGASIFDMKVEPPVAVATPSPYSTTSTAHHLQSSWLQAQGEFLHGAGAPGQQHQQATTAVSSSTAGTPAGFSSNLLSSTSAQPYTPQYYRMPSGPQQLTGTASVASLHFPPPPRSYQQYQQAAVLSSNATPNDHHVDVLTQSQSMAHLAGMNTNGMQIQQQQQPHTIRVVSTPNGTRQYHAAGARPGQTQHAQQLQASTTTSIKDGTTSHGTIATAGKLHQNLQPSTSTSSSSKGPAAAPASRQRSSGSKTGSRPGSRSGSKAASMQQFQDGANINACNNTQCFVVDVSCLGANRSGFLEAEPGAYVRSGTGTGMLLSVKGFSSGKHYWEFLNTAEPGPQQQTAGVDIKFGVVPRGVETRININQSVEENEGHCVTLAQGRHFRPGDTLGVLLDASQPQAKLSFWINGKFSADARSLPDIPKSYPLFPAISLEGSEASSCSFVIKENPPVPDLLRHAQAEAEHEASGSHGATYQDELSARKVAGFHTGNTVEISANVTEDLSLTVGDAVLFVELEDVADENEWRFAIDREDVVAQDVFYLHREFDLNFHPGHTVLKVAFKFVALAPGVAVFRSCYHGARCGPPSAASWRQTLRVVVQEAAA
ncbi:unnamed protein product [Amoebophrya sp. A120]|nr:unnamed protein product [Amoebophrya sp. A120]|eukprot:GSA120T00010794001.1